MHIWKGLLFSALVLGTGGFVSAGELPTAKPAEVGLDADKIQQARDAVKALIDKKEMAGAVVAVARKGKVVMFEALGEMEAGSGKAGGLVPKVRRQPGVGGARVTNWRRRRLVRGGPCCSRKQNAQQRGANESHGEVLSLTSAAKCRVRRPL